jgi:hypothetical protein
MMSNLVLFSYGGPDLMMAGAAVLAVTCGIVLMGGRSAIGPLLRALASLRGRGLQRGPVAGVGIPVADRRHEQDANRAQRLSRRVA